MFKKKILRYVIKYMLITCGVICFPWLFTLMIEKDSVGKVYKTADSGLYVYVGDNRLNLEDFIGCVLIKQMDINASEEALKSQAVVIRTLICERLKGQGVNEIDADVLGFQYVLYDDMEKIWGEKFTQNYNKLMKVLSNTAMEVIVFEDKIITPYYHSASCGYTRDGEAVLGAEYKYLKSVASAKDVEAEGYLTGVAFDKSEFASRLREALEDISIDDEKPLETMQIISRDEAGYVTKLQIGNVQMTGDDFVHIFQLNSPNFQVDEYDGDIRIVTKGLGHGLGLSMYGAEKLAESGKSYKEILSHYYAGTELTKYSNK